MWRRLNPMPSLEWNLKVWDRAYDWPAHGDEWTQMADFAGVPYASWKATLAKTFLIPYLMPGKNVIEIGPGHGRWSEMIPGRIAPGICHLVDISPSCLDYCRTRLAAHANVQYHHSDGRGFPAISAGTVDFVWSFDTFVHIEEPELKAYCAEFRRVMKPQALGVLHHPGNPTPDQRRNGMRSEITSTKISMALAAAKLHTVRQLSEWAPGHNFALTGDALTVFARP